MKRILLVDDEPDILQTLRMILTTEGYAVETAWSSREALALATHEHFDLLVIDFNMPEMKGDELAQLIKEHRPETPVLMLTASAEILRANGRSLAGVDVLMAKPFSVLEFRTEIARLLAEADVSADSLVEEDWSDNQQAETTLRAG